VAEKCLQNIGQAIRKLMLVAKELRVKEFLKCKFECLYKEINLFKKEKFSAKGFRDEGKTIEYLYFKSKLLCLY